MVSAPTNDNAMFQLEGPDQNGDVWLICSDQPVDTVINLGPCEKVASIMRAWLTAQLPQAGK
jgi:hypothetical protein